MWNLIPPTWRIYAALAIAVGVFGGVAGLYAKGHADGYGKADLEWTVKYQQREAELRQQLAQEIDRQAAANDAAKADEEAQLEVYRQKLVEMADLAQQLATEAAADKNAGNVALDAAAVDRHNRRLK